MSKLEKLVLKDILEKIKAIYKDNEDYYDIKYHLDEIINNLNRLINDQY